ncbi:MAG: M28 family peptidase [Chitinophagales bacterium]|nr:M28 family peptidase [Chitinophagales bacterium]
MTFSRSVFPIFTVITLLLACASCNHPKAPLQQQDTTKEASIKNITVPDFNADSAYAFIAKQVSFGPRIPGTTAQNKCAQWITEKVKQYTANVMVQDVEVTLYNQQKMPCKNIIASFNPDVPKRVLLFAHWDTRPWSDRDSILKNKSFDGADDGGSGVAVLMEIARLMSRQTPYAGIDIAFFDVEDYGPPLSEETKANEENAYALGTQYWAAHPHVANYRAYYGVLLDMVGARNAVFPMEGFSMDKAPSIEQKIWNTAQSLGYGKFFINDRANAVTDDHSYVNQNNGTPSVDIIYLDKFSPTGFAPHWHTQKDNMEIIDKNTLKAVGQTLLQVIYSETPEF